MRKDIIIWIQQFRDTGRVITLQKHFGARNITPEQLKESWGVPDNEDEHSITWKISDNKVIIVYFADSGYVYDCKID